MLFDCNCLRRTSQSADESYIKVNASCHYISKHEVSLVIFEIDTFLKNGCSGGVNQEGKSKSTSNTGEIMIKKFKIFEINTPLNSKSDHINEYKNTVKHYTIY